MIDMKLVYNRVAKWNSARYDRVYDKDLTVALLEEEYEEFFSAKTQVERLDALCDIIYVAVGALWKKSATDEDNAELFQYTRDIIPEQVNVLPIDCIFYVKTMIEYMKCSDNDIAIYMVINLCFYQMQSMGISIELAYRAVLVVCDSNDSKSIAKLKPGEKGYGYKGDYYTPPTVGLTKILEEAHVNYH